MAYVTQLVAACLWQLVAACGSLWQLVAACGCELVGVNLWLRFAKHVARPFKEMSVFSHKPSTRLITEFVGSGTGRGGAQAILPADHIAPKRGRRTRARAVPLRQQLLTRRAQAMPFADHIAPKHLLRLYRHVFDECAPGKKCCTLYCVATTKLCAHLSQCKNRSCAVPHCLASRRVLTHYYRCRVINCATCGPTRTWRRRAPSAGNEDAQEVGSASRLVC